MPSSPNTFTDKHPDAIRPATIDWTEDLISPETIATSSWAVSGPDSALILTNPSATTLLATVFVSGGTLGAQYKLTNTIVTNSAPPKTLVSVKYLNVRDK